VNIPSQNDRRYNLLGLGWYKKRLLTNGKRLGRWGEKHGERFLRSRGLKTLARNFTCRVGEIDLIMTDTEGTIVFVEVKTRSDEHFVEAERTVSRGKQAKMVKASRYFLSSHKIEERPCRFDVVTVVLPEKGRVQTRHYENAFTA
jgi:putative endonuclease